MTELEKIEYAKSFIDKLANGINPLDDSAIKADDIVNNVRISRCLFFVSDILRQVIEEGKLNKRRKKREPFSITAIELARFNYSQTPIPISEIAKRINALKETENMRNISHRDLTNWLLSIGMLCEVENTYDGKMTKRPTVQGEAIGISTEERTGQRGIYTVTVYNQSAQEFIIDNFDAVLALKNSKQ